jgi:hypothetical protein
MRQPRPATAWIAVALLLLGASSCASPVEPRAESSPDPSGSSASGTPSPTYLAESERWAPPTYREGGHTVMPVTFPDGTTAELVYAADLGLEELSVYPDTFAEGGPRACGWTVHATRYDPHLGWVTGDAPLARHVTQDGAAVALWGGTRDHLPYNSLVYRFGSWSVLVLCKGSTFDEDLAMLAERLHGFEAPDGLLVLEGTPPLVLHPWRDQNAPALRLSGTDIVIDLRPLSDQCDPATDWGGDMAPGDGVVQWCVQPQGRIWLYANGFSAEGKGFLQRLVSELEIRNVEPAGSPNLPD